MSLPLVTRFGADPLLDLEVANKRYVDSASSTSDKVVLQGSGITTLSGGNNNFNFAGGLIGSWSTSEAGRSVAAPFTATRIENMQLYIRLNTMDATTVYSYRIAGASGNMTLSILAAATGVFVDDTNTDECTQGELLSYRGDASLSTVGGITMNSLSAIYSGITVV